MRSHDLIRLLDEPGRGASALAPQKISIWRLSRRKAVSGVRQPGRRFEVRRCGVGRPFRAPSAQEWPRFVASHFLGLRAPKPGRWPRPAMLTRSERCRWRASEAACRRKRAAAVRF